MDDGGCLRTARRWEVPEGEDGLGRPDIFDLRTNPVVVFVTTKLRINRQTQRKAENAAVTRSNLGAYTEDVFGKFPQRGWGTRWGEA
jgi:hypothetical protein